MKMKSIDKNDIQCGDVAWPEGGTGVGILGGLEAETEACLTGAPKAENCKSDRGGAGRR